MPDITGTIEAASLYVGPDGKERLSFLVVAEAEQTKATLDLGTAGAGALDTVVRAKEGGVGGNSITVALEGDSEAAAGVTIEETGTTCVIHFEDDVSTVADVEAAITSDSRLIEVATAGTGATVLDAATDEFTAESLAGGGYDITTEDGVRPDPTAPKVPDSVVGETVTITLTANVVTAIAWTAS